jgi:NAD(P)H-dependent FMN reductase
MRIEIISGSPREGSITKRVALFLQQHLQQLTTHQVGLIDVREWALPPLQDVFYTLEATPQLFRPLSERIFAANAFILVTPEYNGSYTPALKNLLDHYPKHSHKAFGIVTASNGFSGGLRATQQLQLLVNALFGIACPQMLVVGQVEKKFDAEGNLIDPAFQRSVDMFTNEFIWLAEHLYPEET